MAISSVSAVSGQFVRAATARGAAAQEFPRQRLSEEAASTLERTTSIREGTIRPSRIDGETTQPSGFDGTILDTRVERLDAIRHQVFGLVDATNPDPLVQREIAGNQPLLPLALAAASAAPQLAANTADATLGAIERAATGDPQDSHGAEVDRREGAPEDSEIDVRVFENAYIIPVGFYVTGPSVPPLTTRLDAEPATTAGSYHGVNTGRGFVPPRAQGNNTYNLGSRTPPQTVVVAPSASLSGAAGGSVALLSTRTVFRQLRNPRAAFQQPSAEAGTFDKRA